MIRLVLLAVGGILCVFGTALLVFSNVQLRIQVLDVQAAHARCEEIVDVGYRMMQRKDQWRFTKRIEEMNR
jgi:hypothetical protein